MNEKNIRDRYTEINLSPASGMSMLLCNTIFLLAAIAFIITASINMVTEAEVEWHWVALIVIGSIYSCIIAPLIYAGLRIVKPNEALVLALFGKYVGTIKKEGFFFVNPFAVGVNPAQNTTTQTLDTTISAANLTGVSLGFARDSKKISLKALTLQNNQQKINDALGNPIVIGIVVIWRVVNTAKAVFNVDNYKEYLSIQCDSALRNIVRLYPYDTNGEEESLRGSSQEISDKIKAEIQEKTEVAGLEIMEARITQLAYAPEIAAAMLQRQQAKATVDARNLLVEGAVGMVEMALNRMEQGKIVTLDDERKAAMVSNLLVVLCGSRDAQPVINSGTLY